MFSVDDGCFGKDNASQNKTLAESLGLQPGASGSKPGKGRTGPVVISDVHEVGPGPHLSTDVVMHISVEGYTPLPPDIARITNSVEPDVTYYWRAQTYDSYNGHVWIANTSVTVPLIANAAYYPFTGNPNGFVARLDRSLTRLIQSTYLGSSRSNDIFGIAIHPATGDVYAVSPADRSA